MDYINLINSLGFDADPFATTNADDEERLSEYFVAPPFFTAVMGTPESPKSSIVFAPRGGGKTALKRQLEIASESKDFLCITYNEFDVTNSKLKDIDEEYHLKNILEMLLTAVITAVHEKGIDLLTKNDRHLLYLMINAHLSKINKTTLKRNINSIKNFGDKAADMWNRFTGPIGLVLNHLLDKIGIGSVEVSEFKKIGGDVGSLKDQLVALQEISTQLGYSSIYVLIDRVDETPITSTGDKAYTFISSIINDLHLLESKGFGYKFFLWDLLEKEYRSVARPDRVKYYHLNWTNHQLKTVLKERLKAFSSGTVSSLKSISDWKGVMDIDDVIAIFAQGSPRTMVRICKEILDQQSEIDASSSLISEAAIRAGFNKISESISREVFSESVIKELQRVHRCDFTIRYIYSDVFKFTQQAALNKVTVWETSGSAIQLGTIQETPGKKPSNHYGLGNILLAKYIFPELSIMDFVDKKIRICPNSNCERELVRDWDSRLQQSCNYCQASITI